MKSLNLSPVLGLLFAVTLSSACIAAWNYHRMSVRVVELEHAQRSLSTLSSELVYRAEFERELWQIRMESLQHLEALRNEDSPDGEWLRQRIPDGVRHAAAPGDYAVPDPVQD